MNDRFPGLPDYAGPNEGEFHAIHHADQIIEYSNNIRERVDFIKNNKPPAERPPRLANLMYVGDWVGLADYRAQRATLLADYQAQIKPLYADYEAKCATLLAGYRAQCATLDAEAMIFIRQHNHNSAWVIGRGLNFHQEEP